MCWVVESFKYRTNLEFYTGKLEEAVYRYETDKGLPKAT